MLENLLIGVRSMRDAAEILDQLNETNKKKNKGNIDNNSFYLVVLNEAIVHKHTELITLLLSDPRYSLKSLDNSKIMKILLTAMDAGNLQVVEVLLRARSSLILRSGIVNGFTHSGTRTADKLAKLNAIEYACLLDQPEMVKLLVSYDRIENKQHHKWYE